jgi:hypothetical protein
MFDDGEERYKCVLSSDWLGITDTMVIHKLRQAGSKLFRTEAGSLGEKCVDGIENGAHLMGRVDL